MKIRTKSKRATVLTLTAGLLMAGLGFQAGAGEKNNAPPIEQIVDRANYVSYYQGNDGRAKVRMTIVGADGNKRIREFTMLRWDRAEPLEEGESLGMLSEKAPEYMGRQRFYVYFHRPGDWEGTVFLVHKYLKRDDDRWLYQPALDLVNRIAAADKRNSFVGSHFVYEDVSGRQVTLDNHELVNTTDQYYVVKNTPKKGKYVKFHHYKMWIHKKSGVVVQTVYFDQQQRKYRKYQVLQVKNIQGFPTVMKSKMTDLTEGSYTVMTYEDVEYNVGVEKDIFSKRYLKNPPSKYIER